MPERLWFEAFVWTDYRVAVVLAVILPLVLLIWALVQKNTAMQRLLTIYWRVASLLVITVYLMIAALPISFLSGLFARLLIPIALWFWVDLNEEIAEQPATPLKLSFTSWRWAISFYSVLGFIGQLPFVSCAFSRGVLEKRFCSVWFDPPFLYKQLIHANTGTKFLGFLGFVGLIIYVIYLSYFVLVRLSKQGRTSVIE